MISPTYPEYFKVGSGVSYFRVDADFKPFDHREGEIVFILPGGSIFSEEKAKKYDLHEMYAKKITIKDRLVIKWDNGSGYFVLPFDSYVNRFDLDGEGWYHINGGIRIRPLPLHFLNKLGS